jgi:hypothetical protein
MHAAGILQSQYFHQRVPSGGCVTQLHFRLSILEKEVRPHGAVVNLVAVRIETSFVSARRLTGSCALFHRFGYGWLSV